METKAPRDWNEDELATVRLMVNHPGWKLWLDYLESRLEGHREALENMIGEKEGFTLIGRIKELKQVLKKIPEAFQRDTKRRATIKSDLKE